MRDLVRLVLRMRQTGSSFKSLNFSHAPHKNVYNFMPSFFGEFSDSNFMTFECRVNMTRSENEDYEQLKLRFCKCWNECSANEALMNMVLKDPSKPDIVEAVNSNRQLEKISCIEDLLKVLEQRCALNEEKPQLLMTIALYCVPLEANGPTSNTVKDWAFKAKDLVNKYKHFMDVHGITSDSQDSTSGVALSYKNVRHVKANNINTPIIPQTTINQDDLTIDNCINYLRSKFGVIGKDWPQFVRALPGINERKIETIRSGKSNANAFFECLKHWKCNSPPEERNRQTLIRAAYKCDLPEIGIGLSNVDS